MFQINEDDLTTLEADVPELCEAIRENTHNAQRVKIRRVKEILSNVRWNYQPHSCIERVEPDRDEMGDYTGGQAT